MKCLIGNNSIKKLKLNHCFFESLSLRLLLRGIGAHESLKTLNLFNN